LDKIVQSANASRPSAVKMCVLLNKPRITRERYTPFGICLGNSVQVLANAQTCSLVSWVIGQRSLAKCVMLLTRVPSPGVTNRQE